MRLNIVHVLSILLLAAQNATAQALAQWRLDAAPKLVIEDNGQPETEFSIIVGALRLRDGRIAIADHASSQIRIFQPDGRWSVNLGRRGSGPGEFQYIAPAGRLGDTLFIFDPGLRRVTTIALSAAPRVLTTMTLNARGGRDYSVVGRGAGGQWLVAYWDQIGWEARPGVHRERGGIGIAPSSGEGRVRWIADMPSTLAFVHNPTGNIQQARYGKIAFSPWMLAVTSEGLGWFGASEASEVVRVDMTTGARKVIRLPLAERRPDRALIEAALAAERSTDPQSRRFREARYSAEFLPRTLPYFEKLVPAADGGIWVQEYAGVRDAAASYLILDREGRLVARVTAPAGIRITDVGDSEAIGVHRDEDGLESVHVYRIRRE